MPPLKNPRWEQFAQLLASPHPPSKQKAYGHVGFKQHPAHANRLSKHPDVAKRIAELQAMAGKILATKMAREEAKAITSIAVSRQSLIEDSVAAYKLAERECNPAAMCTAIRLVAELAHISLKAPEDKPQPQQHLHLHEGMIDRPPNETLEQWIERKQTEADKRVATKRLKVVSSDTNDER